MKVLLVVPNFRWVDINANFLWDYIPYNLCLIAATIRDNHEVKIIDAYHDNLSEESLQAQMRLFYPDIVGVTCMMDQYKSAMFRVCQMVPRGAKCVVGGVYASTNPERCGMHADVVIQGESEIAFKEFLDNGVHFPGPQALKLNPSSLPRPAYDLIDYPNYINRWNRPSVDRPPALPYARILTSRGCPYNCNFCQVKVIHGKKYRPRSVDHIIDEMKWLRDTYGIKSWVFDDDNMLEDRARAIDLFESMIRHDLDLPWCSIATPVYKVDDEILTLMKSSGCVYVDYAIESGTERVLKEVIHKPVNLLKAAETVLGTVREGIFTTCNFIIGFPTETWDEIRITLYVADNFNADYTKISVATPLKGTELWKQCEEHKCFKPGFTGWDLWSTGQIQTSEFTPDELTILRAYEWDRINFSTPRKIKKICERMDITEEELTKQRKATRVNAHEAVGLPI